MDRAEGEDEFRDAEDGAATDPPPSSSPASTPSKPTPAATAGFGRRLLASIPLRTTFSTAIGRPSTPSSPKTPPPSASNVGLGLLLDLGPKPCVDGSDASAHDLHLPPEAALQQQRGEEAALEEQGATSQRAQLALQHGKDQFVGDDGGVGEELVVLVPVEEEGRLTAEGGEKEGGGADGCSENRNGFSLQDQEGEGEQRTSDQLGAAVEDQEVVEKEGATKYNTGVEDQSNNITEQCTGDASRAIKVDNIVEDQVVVEEERSTKYYTAVEYHCNNATEQCTGDAPRAVKDDNDQDVVLQEGATKYYIAVEDQSNNVTEQCTGDAPRAVKDDNIAEDQVVVEKEGSTKNDYTAVEDQSNNAAEQCTGDAPRAVNDDNAMKDQEAVVQEGATKCCTAVEDESNNTAEQCTSDAPRAVKDGNLLEEKGKAMEQGGPVGTLGAAEYGIVVGPQEEEDVLVKGQGQDVISVQDQHKVVEQCTSDELGVAMGDSTVQDQEVVVVEQEGVTEYYDAAVEDQNNNAAVEKCSSDELRAVEDGNVVEEKKKAVDQEGAIVILGAAKDGVAVGSQEQEEGDVVIVVVAEQGEDGMSLQNQDKVVEQCTSEQLRTTMDDNAVQDHEVVEQDGAIVESGATADATAVEAQEKVLEQSAGDESRTTKDESAVEDKEKVADQEGVIDKQDANNDCSALGSKEQGDVEGGIYVQDQDKVMEQYTSDQLRTTTYDNGTEDYEVVEKGGANVERGAIADGIVVEAQEKTVEQSAGDELGATKGENVVEDKEKAVNLSVFEKQGAIMDDSALELQEEPEDMVVAEQGEDGISDELRATKDENAVEDKKKVVNLGVIYRQGAIKDGSVVELQEEPEDIVVVEHGEDSISVQYHNKVVEQCTNDQLRATTDDNDVEDQEVSREKDRVCAGYPQRPGRSNCRFYMSNRNRSYGLSCYYNHPQLEAKPEVSRFPSEQGNREVAEFLELNRVGLPI